VAEACRLSWRRARGCALLVGVQHDRTSAARLMADMLLRLLLAALALGAGVRPAHAQGATPAPGLNRRPLLYWRPGKLRVAWAELAARGPADASASNERLCWSRRWRGAGGRIKLLGPGHRAAKPADWQCHPRSQRPERE